MTPTIEYERPLFSESRRPPKLRFLAVPPFVVLLSIPLLIQSRGLRTVPPWWTIELSAMAVLISAGLMTLNGTIHVRHDRVELTQRLFGMSLTRRQIPVETIAECEVRGEILTRERLRLQNARDGSMLFLYWTTGVEVRLIPAGIVMIGSADPQKLRSAIDVARAGAK